MAGDLSRRGYRLHLNKGEYFGVNSLGGIPVSPLVYPPPEHAGKGIHVTVSPSMAMEASIGQ